MTFGWLAGGAGQSEPSSSIQDMKQELHEGDDAVPASQLAARTAGAPGPSAEGLVGVTELLDACVANLEIMPQLDDVVKVRPLHGSLLMLDAE